MIWGDEIGRREGKKDVLAEGRALLFRVSDQAAHLYTGDPDAHRSDDLQVVQDEFLQFADAAALEGKHSVVCCIS